MKGKGTTDTIFVVWHMQEECILDLWMDIEVEDVRPGGRPRKTWGEVKVEKACHVWQLSKEDATDDRKWRKLIKDVV